MRHFIIAAVLLFSPLGQARSQETSDSAHVVSLIRQLEEDWARALIEQDSMRLQQLLAPEFALLVSANPGQPLYRRDWLALLPRYRTQAMPISQLTVRVLRDIAVASFVTDFRATVAGSDRSNVLFITDVWRKGLHGWQVVARYSSIPEPARPATQLLQSPPASNVDHIIVGIDTLERGIRLLREQTGVTPVFGGVHPGRGTRNALMSLGRGVYLELIAPNFADTANAPRVAFFSQFRTLTPYGWAVGTTNADSLAARAAARGLAAGSVAAGSRARPDGSMLAWRTTVPWPRPFGAYLPFFIEWSATSPHPSTQSPAGCTLAAVRMTSPAPDSLRSLLARGEVAIPVAQGSIEGLQFDLDCPRGRVEFR